MTTTVEHAPAPVFWRDIRILRVVGQLVFLVIVVLLFSWFANNTIQGLDRAGLAPNFSFLNQTSSFQIDEGLVSQPHLRTDTFGHAFLIGFINTLRVIFIGLFLTTIVGLVMGIARLSTNWLIRQIASVYVEVMQNTPLLVQLVFLYAGVFLTLPAVRDAVTLPGPVYMSVRGTAVPLPRPTETTAIWLLTLFIGAVLGIILWWRQRQIWITTGQDTHGVQLGLGLFLLIAFVAWLVLPTAPVFISLPRIAGLRYAQDEGAVVSPEFMAILTGLVLYTGAFIAEIVRAGIQSVPNGQWEAARAQGLSYYQILRLVVLPQALRVMIPPLTNQYLNLIKNSSLGAAVGYSDLFGVSQTIRLQSGQSVPVIVIVMITYLVLDLAGALIMNMLNSRFQIKTR